MPPGTRATKVAKENVLSTCNRNVAMLFRNRRTKKSTNQLITVSNKTTSPVKAATLPAGKEKITKSSSRQINKTSPVKAAAFPAGREKTKKTSSNRLINKSNKETSPVKAAALPTGRAKITKTSSNQLINETSPVKGAALPASKENRVKRSRNQQINQTSPVKGAALSAGTEKGVKRSNNQRINGTNSVKRAALPAGTEKGVKRSSNQQMNETSPVENAALPNSREKITKTSSNQLINETSPVKGAALPSSKENRVKRSRNQQKNETSPVKGAALPAGTEKGVKRSSNQLVNKKSPVKAVTLPASKDKRTNKSSNHLINESNKNTSPVKGAPLPAGKVKRVLNKSFSFRILEDKVQSPKNAKQKLAVYDFTFDPNEEPSPQKKKKKRVVRKRGPPKSKIIMKHNYDENISKALQSLKDAVRVKFDNKAQFEENIKASQQQPKISASNQLPTKLANVDNSLCNNDKPTDNVESIVEDFDDNINYSPETSPRDAPRPQVKLSAINETRDLLYDRARSTICDNQHRDPLNLLEELSFTDEVPIASSSMNTSVRHPLASPWRAEFNNLPIKWQDNAYVKPNMTPALESSFISSLDQKKHVYTEIVSEDREPLPEVVTNDNTWKQTSIISFIKEVAERSAMKKLKKLKKALTPVKKNNSLSKDDVSNENLVQTEAVNTSNESAKSSENRTPLKRKINDKEPQVPTKSPRLDANTENYFGFDESDNQENVSPNKKTNQHKRALRPRARAVLKEINAITGPLRAQIPVTKTKLAANSEVINKLFNDLKSASDAPNVAESPTEKETDATPACDPTWHGSMEENNAEAESLHLFEDIDVVHHLKPHRKSYGNSKKVTFCQQQTTDQLGDEPSVDSENEDPDDLPFQMPATIKTKKAAPKKKKVIKLTKKEEEEVEAWAAAFNSMCEDVEEFPLVVE